MAKSKKTIIKRQLIKFFFMFFAVVSAFALNKWNDDRKSSRAETKILTVIKNGLLKDIEDVKLNKKGHEQGILACDVLRKALKNSYSSSDSLTYFYLQLTRDYISVQNISGYETLKSKGLELIENDSLRFKIISIYEYNFKTLKTLEEDYFEMQFHRNYFKEINTAIAPNLVFNKEGILTGINLPLNIEENKKKEILMYLVKIHMNRLLIINYYNNIEKEIIRVLKSIELELN